MEYIFSDTRKELPETYEYLERIEDYLGKSVNRLNAELGFDHWYDVYGGMIPSNHRRWCTKMLKLKPFEDSVGDAPCINYVSPRADENRAGDVLPARQSVVQGKSVYVRENPGGRRNSIKKKN